MKTLSKWTRATHFNNISSFDLGGRGGGFFVLVSNELRGALPPPPGQECESGTWNIGNKKKKKNLQYWTLSYHNFQQLAIDLRQCLSKQGFYSRMNLQLLLLTSSCPGHKPGILTVHAEQIPFFCNPIGCLPISRSVLLRPVWPILRWVIVISLFCDRDRNVSECCRNQFLYRWYPSASAKFTGFESSVHESFSSVHLLPQKVH